MGCSLVKICIYSRYTEASPTTCYHEFMTSGVANLGHGGVGQDSEYLVELEMKVGWLSRV